MQKENTGGFMATREPKIWSLEILLNKIAAEPLMIKKGEYVYSRNERKFSRKMRALKRINHELYMRYNLTYIEIQNSKLTGEQK